MAFYRTRLLASDREILINLDHVENVYEDHGRATFVMISREREQLRAFETSAPFSEAASTVLLNT